MTWCVASRRTQGQLLAPKALVYLVFVALWIILAVWFLVKIWNATLGATPATQDAALLARVINQLIDDERPYVQVPILLRVDTERVIGFDDNPTGVQYKNPKYDPNNKNCMADPNCLQTVQLTKPASCGSNSCICNSRGKALTEGIGECSSIPLPPASKYQGNRIASIKLVANYHPYKVPAEYQDRNGEIQSLLDPFEGVSAMRAITNRNPSNQPDPAYEGVYHPLLIDPSEVRILQFTNKVVPGEAIDGKKVDGPKAIIPLIVEKIVLQGTIVIVVSPDSDSIRARNYFLYQCPENSVQGCERAHPFSSGQWVGNDYSYCTTTGFSGRCTREPLIACSLNQRVFEPCFCNGNRQQIAIAGACTTSQGNVNIRCNLVDSCEEYCGQDGESGCSDSEKQFCDLDPYFCDVAPPGEKCAILTTSNSNFVSRWLATAGLMSECQPEKT